MASRNPHLIDETSTDDRLPRRWCQVCGCELPPQARGAGRPRLYCPADTGRPCAALVKTLATLRAQTEAVLHNSPSTHREGALRNIRGSMRILAQDLAITAAQLDGSPTRAALVGDPKRDKTREQFGA